MADTKQKRNRFSPQRAAILELILDHGGHLAVEEIYRCARKSMPRISLGTVYRNLEALESQKQIIAAQGFNLTYFEPYQEPHHHFVCTKCSSIQNVSAPTVSVCTGCIHKNAPFIVHKMITTLFGLCKKCKDR